jgi:hypothetical protein
MSRYYARNRSIIGGYHIAGGIPGGDQGFGEFGYNQILGGAFYITPGSYSWTCPGGVTSVSVVAVGGGGGGNVSSFAASPAATAGGTSYFVNTSTCGAGGGGTGLNNISGGYVSTNGGSLLSSFGISGSAAGPYPNSFLAGSGGGAGLLSNTRGATFGQFDWGGAGGHGANLFSMTDTSGIAGGAGTSASEGAGGVGGNYGGGGGGGRDATGGGGGALAYINSYATTPGSTYTVVVGTAGNGAGVTGQRKGGNGARGCVRIIWGRTFSAGANIAAINETTI